MSSAVSVRGHIIRMCVIPTETNAVPPEAVESETVDNAASATGTAIVNEMDSLKLIDNEFGLAPDSTKGAAEANAGVYECCQCEPPIPLASNSTFTPLMFV